MNWQYTPLLWVERVFGIKILANAPTKNWLPIRVDLDVKSVGRRQHELSVCVPPEPVRRPSIDDLLAGPRVTAATGLYAQRSSARAPATRTANCSASFGGSSGRPGSAPCGRQAAQSSDFSTTFPRARDQPIGNIEPIDGPVRLEESLLLREGRAGTQPLLQLRPPPPARDVAHRDGNGLLLPNQNH